MTKNRCESPDYLILKINHVFAVYSLALPLYPHLCRVVDTLKDYAIKALVNTVDHLGSVTYKVNDLLDEKVEEVSGTEFRVSCIEQVSHLYQLALMQIFC